MSEIEEAANRLGWCVSTIEVYNEFRVSLFALLEKWNERLPEGFRQELADTLEVLLLQIQDLENEQNQKT